jgi:hypothetical protein
MNGGGSATAHRHWGRRTREPTNQLQVATAWSASPRCVEHDEVDVSETTGAEDPPPVR